MPVAKQPKSRERSTLRQHGPCLTCRAQDIQYGRGNGFGLAGPHVQYGDEWLDDRMLPLAKRSKPFVFVHSDRTRYDPDKRQRVPPDVPQFAVIYDISRYGDVNGTIESVSGISYDLVRPYICNECKTDLEARLGELVDAARQQKTAEEERQLYEETWRQPRPREFPVENGSQHFMVVAPTLSFNDVILRWKTSGRLCRGSSPAFVMMVTVDGRFRGKYLGTYGMTNAGVEAKEYAATYLLTRWMQQSLQRELLAAKPTFTWNAREPRGCSCNGGVPEPSIFQTLWTDGTRYAAVANFSKISEVVTLLEQLGYKLIERQNRRQAGDAKA